MARQNSGERQRWRNLRIVREPDVRRHVRLWVVLSVIGLAVAPITFHLLQQMEYVQVHYRIEELRTQHEQLVEQEQRLRIERAALQTPLRVERCARRELRLTRPQPDRVVVVQAPVDRASEQSLVARGPANR